MRRKISKGRLEQLQNETGARILRKGNAAADKVVRAIEAAKVVPKATVTTLLDSHDDLMGEVEALKQDLATKRMWHDLTFHVKRTRKGMSDELEVSSVDGASATFKVNRDGEGFISSLSVVRDNPGISLRLKVVRNEDNVMTGVVAA